MEQPSSQKMKLYLGGDTSSHIGWVQVYNGVNVIEYTEDHQAFKYNNNFIILALGDALKEEFFGAFDRTRHTMPY